MHRLIRPLERSAFIVALAATLITGVAGCGSSSPSSTDEALVVKGVVHVDSVFLTTNVEKDGHASHQCTVEDLKDKQVVIVDPDGKKVAVADIATLGEDDPMPADVADRFYAGRAGTCNLAFEARAKGRSGIYTAEIEGYPGTSTSFPSAEARDVTIEFEPSDSP